MFHSEDMWDSMKRFHDDMTQQFQDHHNPILHFYSASFKSFLEFQKCILKIYQKSLNDTLHPSAHEEINNMYKSFMKSYMQYMHTERENRERFLQIHTEMIQYYIDNIENILNNLNME
jgi:hypothetical protein